MRKLYSLRFQHTAEQDLNEIVEHLQEVASLGVAAEWSVQIGKHMDQLRSFPKGYSYLSNTKYRRMIHGKYIILFRVSEDSRSVVVCRIFHGSRLQENIGPLEDEP